MSLCFFVVVDLVVKVFVVDVVVVVVFVDVSASVAADFVAVHVVLSLTFAVKIVSCCHQNYDFTFPSSRLSFVVVQCVDGRTDKSCLLLAAFLQFFFFFTATLPFQQPRTPFV